MKIIEKKIDELVPYENNPRRNALAVEPVANSIQRFKFRNPILIDKNNVIIAGHTRLLAAKKLGLEKVPCITIDDLTPDEVKAYRIADNKTGEFSTWDDSKLQSELKELSDLGFGDIEAMGFNEIERMLVIDDEEEVGEYTQEPLPDKKTFAEYEAHADEESLMAYNVIIACMSDEEQEWLKQVLAEDGRLKRFYTVQELKERDII